MPERFEKCFPDTNRIGNFDNHIGWSRRVSKNKFGHILYTMWQCVNGKRYLINVSVYGTRYTMSDQLRTARAILRKVAYHDFDKEPFIKMSWEFTDRVEVTKYRKGQLQFEGDKAGPKSKKYFKNWIGQVLVLFENSGISSESAHQFITENIQQIRRDCDNLGSPDDVLAAYKTYLANRFGINSIES